VHGTLEDGDDVWCNHGRGSTWWQWALKAFKLQHASGVRFNFLEVHFRAFYSSFRNSRCCGLARQLATKHQTAARSPFSFPPQRDGEEKWTKEETRELR